MVSNVDGAGSYKMNMDMDMVTTVTGGSNPGSITVKAVADGAFDMAVKPSR
jgi:hypothetical protein